MNATQFAKILIKFNWRQSDAAWFLGCHERTVRSYVLGEHKVPHAVEQLLWRELSDRNMRMPSE